MESNIYKHDYEREKRMHTYKLAGKLEKESKVLHQTGRFIYHVLSFFFGDRKNWNKNISFSQCGEDLLVSYILKNIMQINKISYLDIGCNHPYRLNNTAYYGKNLR